MSQRQKRSNDPTTPLAEYSTATTGISNNNPFANSKPTNLVMCLNININFNNAIVIYVNHTTLAMRFTPTD